MAFRAPPKILQRVMKFKAIKHDRGKFLIWGNPAFIDPIYIQLYYHKLVEKSCKSEANRIRYHVAKFQAEIGTRIINERFGYAKTLKEKQSLTIFNQGQTEVLGLGSFNIIRMDFKNNIFMYKGVSPFAEEYKRFFGLQKKPVDYWLMGMWAGAFEVITGKKMLCLETKCVASGASSCEFVVKPVESWSKSDANFKSNSFLVKDEPGFKGLGSKFTPYLGLPKHG